jgi:16S rRNA A1518/A1519 N6-dimethyltransferase RsmA/KsgA/DIM1 with predicted DNA glycosylase/AP lyase activity
LIKFNFKTIEKKSFLQSENVFDNIEKLTQTVFRHKNKKLSSVQMPLSDFGIDVNLRAHHLSPDVLIDILKRKNNVLNPIV